jgi:diguanylate cyclase (GGDEF)-like protein
MVAAIQQRLRAGLGGEGAIWALGLLVAAAAVAVYALFTHDLPGDTNGHNLPWWALAAVFAMAEAWVVHFHFRRSSHSFSLGELPLVFGLLFLSPHELLAASVIGSSIPLFLDREIPAVKVFFNIAQFTLGTCVAIAVFEHLAPSRDALTPEVWSATLIAVFATAAVADLTIGAAIGLAEGRLSLGTRLEMLAINWGVASVNGCLALSAATVYAVAPAAALFLLLPAAMLIFAYRAYMSERRRHTELEFLHEATNALSRSPEIVPELEVLLERTRKAFRTEVAELVLFSAEFGPSLRSTLGPGDRKQMLETLDERVVNRLRVFAEKQAGVVSLSAVDEADLRDWWADRGLREGVLVALKGESRVVGLLVLAEREGVERSFSSDELRLVETLAGNVTVALQYDHLEHAVRELTTLRADLEREAFYCSLTGLANRSLFVNRVDKALRTRQRAVFVLFIDIDDFKTINDTLGHQAGDEVLVEVAKRLQRCLRDGDTAARLGGDEFAVLLEDDPTESDAIAVAERTLAEFRNPVHVAGDGISIQLSIGVARGIRGVNTADDLLRNADVAMYGAKDRGKNQLLLFEPGMQRAIEQRHRLKRELERAIERRDFSVHYQPIFDLTNGEAVAIEALVRWNHRERGSVSPGDFIPFAEESGLIVPIGQLVLEDACRQAAVIGEARNGQGALAMHVNVSTIELLDPGFLERLDSLVLVNGLSPWQLTIEITEHVLVFDETLALATLEAARERGYRVAIDDFGTGYSSLAYLRSLPIDTIKIPKTFIDGVGGSTKDDMFARAVFDFGSKLDLSVVAEGVERAEQAAILESLGCEMAQGFYFAPPEPAGPDLVERLSSGRPLLAPVA